jgi:hypothetical protein
MEGVSLRDPAFERAIFGGGVLREGHVAVVIIVVELNARDEGHHVVVEVDCPLVGLSHLIFLALIFLALIFLGRERLRRLRGRNPIIAKLERFCRNISLPCCKVPLLHNFPFFFFVPFFPFFFFCIAFFEKEVPPQLSRQTKS